MLYYIVLSWMVFVLYGLCIVWYCRVLSGIVFGLVSYCIVWHCRVLYLVVLSCILSVYKNGQLANTGAMVITGTISNSSTLNLGRRANAVGGGNIYFTGSIGIVRIYSESLNATQVLQNYNANKSTFGLS